MACGTTTSPALMPPTTSARSHSRRYRRSQPRAGMTALAVTGATDWNTGSGGAPLLGVREQRPDHRDVEGEHGQRPQRSDEDHEHRQRGADGGEERAQDLAEGVAAEDQDRGEDLQRPDDEPEPSPGGDVDAVEHVLDRLSLVVLGDGGDAAEDVPDADDADHDGRERGPAAGHLAGLRIAELCDLHENLRRSVPTYRPAPTPHRASPPAGDAEPADGRERAGYDPLDRHHRPRRPGVVARPRGDRGPLRPQRSARHRPLRGDR